ncbi:hypothetical protein [Desulfovibrio inopinatus]|uniref:hypothetical protein n=1 Tax=Desulfovibrio inopinatus TaxID=102109 RepID=UPI0009FDF7E1|nr:hypothetical protein [Desulfovibrio inopinatus]
MDVRAYLRHGSKGPYLRIRLLTGSSVTFRNLPLPSSLDHASAHAQALAYVLNRHPGKRVVMQLSLPLSIGDRLKN